MPASSGVACKSLVTTMGVPSVLKESETIRGGEGEGAKVGQERAGGKSRAK
jgi:hypothetical protein